MDAAEGSPEGARLAPEWTGRRDGDGPEHARWHQVARPAGAVLEASSSRDHIGLLGFCSDEGVRRNGGRPGARSGPAALRRALAPLAAHGDLARQVTGLIDHGDAVTGGDDLETGQADAARLITGALDAPGCRLAIVLGGGHETAWASYQGLMAAQRLAGRGGQRPRWGVLNLDAHFDLRQADRPTSGTPFWQMAEAERAAGRELRYAVIGIAEPSNTPVLFEAARGLGVRWLTDVDCWRRGEAGIEEFVADFARTLDVLYLTIDLDVLPTAVAPGVSAPAAFGVGIHLVAAAVRAAAATGKLALLDVVELNPALDIDARTARTAARLIDEAVRAHVPPGRTADTSRDLPAQ